MLTQKNLEFQEKDFKDDFNGGFQAKTPTTILIIWLL